MDLCAVLGNNRAMLAQILDFVLHIDVHLGQIITNYGIETYVILFLIIFVETGLVLIPFLPGDSLLFAAGAFAALGLLNIWWLIPLLMVAAILGDTVNYWIGYYFGKKLVESTWIPINDDHIEQTKIFFNKHGRKTIILARFVPIVRTFAPFVAGISRMHYGQFISYNIIGGVAWVTLATTVGYIFGNIPVIHDNFSLIVLLIVLISVLPMIIELIKEMKRKK